MEEDQLHQHGHSVSDPGHTHPYVDKYLSHNDLKQKSDSFGDWAVWKSENQYQDKTTSRGRTGIRVSGITGSQYGDETRPRNMDVIYIIRVW